jgi:hypothetical protein
MLTHLSIGVRDTACGQTVVYLTVRSDKLRTVLLCR